MIKKLKLKFILINMLSVSTILLAVLLMIGITNYTRQEQEIHNSLIRAMEDLDRPDLPKIEILGPKDNKEMSNNQKFNPFTTFSVTLDDTGEIITTNTSRVSIEEELLQDASQVAYSSIKDFGSIKDYNLRYYKSTTPDGIRIVFLDITNQMQSFHSLLITLGVFAVVGLIAYFFISLFLANWSIKPVATAWEQQRQFIADASHELKTPLTVILANAGIVLNHKTDTVAAQEKWITYIKEEAIRMKKLVEDMLFLAKSDAARLPALSGSVNVSDLVWSALLPFESVAFEQGLTLESEIAPDISMEGNESQLRQLVVILVDNACKYANEKGTITVRFLRDSKIHLYVHNTGAWITPAQQKHLFERFYRTDESRERREGGYGLGLSIAKSIVDNHHGKILVHSDPAEGTTFEVQL